jgi:hypothetical protein
MVKKRETEKKEKTAKPHVKGEIKVEKVLIENFVSLQQVMTNLAVKFDSLSNQISKLLELFEISAKTLAERGALGEDKDKKVAEKLDSLLEQNKVIAKGIALLHEKNVPEQYAPSLEPVQRPYPQPQQPMQRFPSKFSGSQKFKKMT